MEVLEVPVQDMSSQEARDGQQKQHGASLLINSASADAVTRPSVGVESSD